MTTTLTDFLLARIAEDEAEAQGEALPWGTTPIREALPVTRRARVLAECEAKRRIVEAMAAPEHLLTDDAKRVADIARTVVLGNLALPYADHPDYDEMWRP